MRLFLLFLGLVVLVLIPFFIWGETFLPIFQLDASIEWLSRYNQWAWAAGMILLLADLVLPIPATLVMSALGYLYGFIAGGLISAAGSFAAGAVGYWLCRLFGVRAAKKILGEKDFVKGERIFDRAGGWLVVLSRWLPVFPEVIACMAGLTRMPVNRFHLALACGSLPLGFIYALVGQTGVENPALAIVLSACLPPVIWILIQPVFKKGSKLPD